MNDRYKIGKEFVTALEEPCLGNRRINGTDFQEIHFLARRSTGELISCSASGGHAQYLWNNIKPNELVMVSTTVEITANENQLEKTYTGYALCVLPQQYRRSN